MISHHCWSLADLCSSTLVGASHTEHTGQHVTEGHTMGAALSLFRGLEDDQASEQPDDPLNPPIDDELLQRIATSKGWAKRTTAEYRTNFRMLAEWWSNRPRSGRPMRFRDLTADNLAQFLAWRFEQAAKNNNAGRVHNKAVEQLTCLLRWGMHHRQGFIDALPRLPDEREQRDDAGICYFALDEIDRIYWATYSIDSPRGWPPSVPVGAYLRCALVLFYNLGLDTQALFAYDPDSRECGITRGDFFFGKLPPSRQMPIESEYGWVWWARKKTGKDFERPLNREMHDHVQVLLADDADTASLLMSCRGRLAGTHRPNRLFQKLCKIAKIQPKIDRVTKKAKKWNLKDLRKTCGTYQEVAGYSPAADALGHSDSKVTYGHYTSGNIRASIALLRQEQPASFRSIWDETIKPPGLLFAK